MVKENKFESNEKKIAEAENILLEGGKYVCTDYNENHLLHLESHKKGGDNMLVKRHIANHHQDIKNKHCEAMNNDSIEAKMVY